MAKTCLQDLSEKDFNPNLRPVSLDEKNLNWKQIHEISEETAWIYYGKRKTHKREFFLPGVTAFFPLEKISEKYEEYRKLAADSNISKNSGFRVDYGILGLLKTNKKVINQLQIRDSSWLESILYELGMGAIKMAYDFEDFNQKRFQNFLGIYQHKLNDIYHIAGLPEKPPFFVNQIMPETPELPVPETVPEQDYLDDILSEIEKEDIPKEPENSGADNLENRLIQIKNEILPKKLEIPKENSDPEKLTLELSEILGEVKLDYNKSECKRDSFYVNSEEIIRCFEPKEKYETCMHANLRFKTRQCCTSEKKRNGN